MDYWSHSPLSSSRECGHAHHAHHRRGGLAHSDLGGRAVSLMLSRSTAVDTALVRVPGASHWIEHRPSHLIAKVNAILAWFERHSKPTDTVLEK